MSDVNLLLRALKVKFPTLVTNETGRWEEFHISEVFKGVADPKAIYVPKVNDRVWDPDVGFFRVTYVDYSTGLSTMVPWYAPDKTGSGGEEENITIGYIPGDGNWIYWCFIDDSKTPHEMVLDKRFYLYGSEAKEMKVFKGTNITSTGTVISAFYNAGGAVIGENIPLAVVAMTNTTNISVKAPVTAWSKLGLQTGEKVTGVVYDDQGIVAAKQEFIVHRTSFIRASEAAQKHIMDIFIQSPFLDPNDANVIRYPINLPLESMAAEGVVLYSDGERRIVPIDGNRLSLKGTENYLATNVGQKIPLVLVYQLAKNETSYNATPGGNGYHIPKSYSAFTKEVDGAYSLKLFVVPRWDVEEEEYRLEYFLLNLDRKDWFKVTHLVEPGITTDNFDPTLYGTIQRLLVTIDISKVDPRFAAYKHAQRFSIMLMGPGNSRQYPWMIEYTPGQREWYGQNLEAVFTFKSASASVFTVQSGITTQEEWLDKLYYNAEPIYLADRENKPAAPTHFTVYTGAFGSMVNKAKFSISNWDKELVSNYFPDHGDAIYIEWTQEDNPDDILYLAVTGLPVRRVF